MEYEIDVFAGSYAMPKSDSEFQGEHPKLFISYSHNSDDHKNWVLKLATRLVENGVDVELDYWNTRLGSNLQTFMEMSTAHSPRVIAVISENYVQKADDLEGGVGVEKNILSHRIMKDPKSPIVIPLVRNNESKTLPLFLANSKYINFNNDQDFESKYTELIYEIYGKTVLPIPELGPSPFRDRNTPIFIQLQASPSRYSSSGSTGTISFDFTNNNGLITLGEGIYEIKTKWTAAGARAIHAYNDSPGIRAIALAEAKQGPEELGDLDQYDFSSRTRTAEPGDCIIWLNDHGRFAITRIDGVFVSHSKPRNYQLDLTYWLDLDQISTPD